MHGGPRHGEYGTGFSIYPIRNFLPPLFPVNTLGRMRSCYLLLLACLFSGQIVKGQGTMLFTWHGNNNYFQASFEVTEAETLPGSVFNSTLFTNSIQITSLDGLTYLASNQQPAAYVGGHFGPPLSLTFILADQNTESSITVAVVPGQGASISEFSPLPNGHHGEQGFWSYEVIPEPSVGSLFVSGLCAWFIKKRKVSNS